MQNIQLFRNCSKKSNAVLLMKHLTVFYQQLMNVSPPLLAPRCMQAILVLARVFSARRCRQAGRWVARYLHLTGVWLFVMCHLSRSCSLDESRTQSWLQHGRVFWTLIISFFPQSQGCTCPPFQGLLMERKPSTLLWNFSLEISGVHVASWSFNPWEWILYKYGTFCEIFLRSL
jgi:hypothetical protein